MQRYIFLLTPPNFLDYFNAKIAQGESRIIKFAWMLCRAVADLMKRLRKSNVMKLASIAEMQPIISKQNVNITQPIPFPFFFTNFAAKLNITDMTYNIKDIYAHNKSFSKKQQREIINTLQSQGISIVKIEAYEYADVPGIKHLFFYFAEDSKKAIPYFMLDSEVWEKILHTIYRY